LAGDERLVGSRIGRRREDAAGRLVAHAERGDVAPIGLHEIHGRAEIVSENLVGISRIPELGGGLEDKAMDVLDGPWVHHRGSKTVANSQRAGQRPATHSHVAAGSTTSRRRFLKESLGMFRGAVHLDKILSGAVSTDLAPKRGDSYAEQYGVPRAIQLELDRQLAQADRRYAPNGLSTRPATLTKVRGDTTV
jgi:hypothetical protein